MLLVEQSLLQKAKTADVSNPSVEREVDLVADLDKS